MNKKLIKNITAITCMLAAGCTHKWDDHNAIQGDAAYVKNNVYEQISANTSLSKFAGFLKQTGYADSISASRTYTVWAPADDALKNLDAAIINNPAALKKFVAHHIATLAYRVSDVQKTAVRVSLLDGKYAAFSATTFDEATLQSKDIVASNGIVHTIASAAVPAGNCWDYVDTLKTAGNVMAAYLKNNQYKAQDLTNAVQIGVNPLTGDPVYQPGTDSVMRNKFTSEVYDVSKESDLYTVFVLDDTYFDAERARYAPFYATGTADSTTDLSRWNTVKDLVVEGAYAPAALPDTIVSKYGVKVAINKSAIVKSYRASNGYVYVMSAMPVKPESKFPEFVIQGENYYSARVMPSSSIFTRTVTDTSTGGTFKDVFVYKHGINQFYLLYRQANVYTTTYKVYWRAVNNTGLLTDPYVQRLAMGSFANATFPYINVAANNYKEVYLGEYKVTNYGNGLLNMYLISANITPTGSNQNQNALLLDYIRLVPSR